MEGQEKWDFIHDMRNKGVPDNKISDLLGYSSVQSMWNWISRNKEKYESKDDIGFWKSLIKSLAGDDVKAYLAGLFLGYFIRDLIETGIDKNTVKADENFSLYKSIWASFFFESSFAKGISHGLGAKDIPRMVEDFSEWYKSYKNNFLDN